MEKETKKSFKLILKQTNVHRVIAFLVFALYAFTMIYSLGWALMNSLKTHLEFMVSPNDFPTEWRFDNYVEAFNVLTINNSSLFIMFFNSVWLAVANAGLSLFSCIAFAYAIARFKFVGRNLIWYWMFAMLMIPVYGAGSSGFKLIKQLGLYDSPLYCLKSLGVGGTVFFVLKTYFESLSKTYSEAAEIDGAGLMTIFIKIMVPMVMPAAFPLLLLMLISAWNDYLTPIMYLPSYPTISSGLYTYEQVAKFNMNKPAYFAGVLMCAIPPIILFSCFSDKIMTNVTMGGIKG